jgi:hypothetical protein
MFKPSIGASMSAEACASIIMDVYEILHSETFVARALSDLFRLLCTPGPISGKKSPIND